MSGANSGEIIKSFRAENSITQEEMAEKLGITQPYLSLIETGKQEPSQKLAEKIRKLVDASAKPKKSFGDWLLEQRTKAGLTREQLAQKAGISYLTIYFVETGKTESPQKATIEAIEKVLGSLPKPVEAEISEEAEVGDFGEYRGPFSIKEWQSYVGDSVPGIYVFYDSLKRPVRVGQTSDLKTRIRQYEDFFWFKPPVVDSIAYIVVKNEKLRRQVETAMIKLVGENAIFNAQHRIA